MLSKLVVLVVPMRLVCRSRRPGAASQRRAIAAILAGRRKGAGGGRYDEAAQAYEKLRELAPNMAEAHARLGLIYFQQGRFEQAVHALRQAIKLKPTLPNTSLLLAMALSELGRYREALPALEKGFKRATDPALKRGERSCQLVAPTRART